MKLSNDDIIDLLTNDGGRFQTDNIDEAYNFCKKIALGHYENFPVASIAIPKIKRKHFYSIYTYCRIADDLGDEVSQKDSQLSLKLLDYLAESAENKFKNHAKNPVFIALNQTVETLNLPSEPFIKLTIAFKKDVLFNQPETVDELLEYCKYSANPVGELVLRLFDEYDEEKIQYSDKICTALQIVNFLQDISIDKKIGRIYIPKNIIPKIKIEHLLNNENKFTFFNSLNELYLLTEKLFNEGKKILPKIKSKRLRTEIKMIITGGEIILKKVIRLKENIIVQRPKLKGIDKIKILIKNFV